MGLRDTGLLDTETDDDHMVRVESDLSTLNDGKLQSVTHYDELGRPVLTRVSDGSSLSTSPTATDGLKVATTYIAATGGNRGRYLDPVPDDLGRDPRVELHPVRRERARRGRRHVRRQHGAHHLQFGNEPDGELRHRLRRRPDPQTDPGGKTREELRDALGRLVTVTEDPGGSLDYDTVYTYDPLGNLLTVVQGSQTHVRLQLPRPVALGRQPRNRRDHIHLQRRRQPGHDHRRPHDRNR